jgi:hypothetical protein
VEVNRPAGALVDVLFGEVTGPRGVPALDRVEDGAVGGDDLAQQVRRVRRRPRQLAQLQVQVHLLHGQPHRMGGGGHLHVEPAVGAALRRRRGLGREPADDLPQPADLPDRGAGRGQAGRRRGDRRLRVAQLAEVRGAELGQPGVGELGERVVAGPDEAAAAPSAARLDQAQFAQLRERVPQGHRRDVEHRGQVGLRRELLAVAEQAERDRAAHPPDDGLAAQRAVVERREHGAPRVAAEHLHGRPPVPAGGSVFHPAEPHVNH